MQVDQGWGCWARALIFSIFLNISDIIDLVERKKLQETRRLLRLPAECLEVFINAKINVEIDS